MTTTTIHQAEQVRAGVARLLGWLTRHEIETAYISYVDGGNAEVELAAIRDGDGTSLSALINVAEALTAVQVNALDQRPNGSGVPVLTIQVSGTVEPVGLHVIARVGITGRHRDALRTALGGPMQPAKHSWLASVSVLRDVAQQLPEAGDS